MLGVTTMMVKNKAELREVVSRLTVRDYRMLIRTREMLRRSRVLPVHDFLVIAAVIRREYIRGVEGGLRQYISEMLGRYAAEPAKNCTIYDASDRVIECNSDNDVTLLQFLETFEPEFLPYRVEILEKGKPVILAL